jgi:putative transposase
MRKPRVLLPGARYHVTARANRKEMILESDSIKSLFLEVLARAKAKYSFKIENFCVMGNHFHLIIRPEIGTNLSRIMQWIMSVFAMSWNRIHGHVGHVWCERFFSRILESLYSYLRTFEYIAQNPVKAGLVKNESDWVYGGLWHLATGNRSILDADVLSDYF